MLHETDAGPAPDATGAATLTAATTPAPVTPSRTALLDVVVPAYNEEGRIRPTLEALCRRVSTAGADVRVVVVDNGSVDATVEAVTRAHTRGVPVTVMSCRAKGKGAAIRAGVAHATAPFVGYIDADQSTPPDALLAGLGLLQHGWDVVIGSRRVLGSRYAVPQPVIRRLGSRVFNLAATGVVGRVRDTQCGMKLFRTGPAQQIFAATRTDGFAFDVEVLARARAAGLKVMELPVTWTDDAASTLSPVRDGIAAFRDLLAVHRHTRHLPRADVR